MDAAIGAAADKGKEMKLEQILATERKIAYVNNTGVDVRMFDEVIMNAIYADSTELPEEIADLFVLKYVQISPNESRAILYAA
jgi:hypothetical protein